MSFRPGAPLHPHAAHALDLLERHGYALPVEPIIFGVELAASVEGGHASLAALNWIRERLDLPPLPLDDAGGTEHGGP